MSDTVRTKILNALLDKYERSRYFRDEKRPARRIMLNFYNGGKTDFPYYDIEQSERRISVNRAAEDMAAENLVDFEWMRGERDHIIARIWLNVENLPAAYRAAGRQPMSDAADALCRELSALKSRIKSDWARAYLQDVYDAVTRRRGLVSAIPADGVERDALLRALLAIDGLDGAEYTERLFSMRVFGDSKRFERAVKPRLVNILRKYLDADDDTAGEELLKQVGIVKYPEQFEFCGDISLALDAGRVDFNCLRGGGAIYSSDLSAGTIHIGPSVRTVLTVENRANYIEYIRNVKTESELVIYHGGQFSPRKRVFLRSVAEKLPRGCEWYHWSDIDYGGFIMLSRLRREVIRDARPYRMGAGELARYRGFAAKTEARYAAKLLGLKARPELSDCLECIDYMLKNMIRLEQEAMMAGDDF